MDGSRRSSELQVAPSTHDAHVSGWKMMLFAVGFPVQIIEDDLLGVAVVGIEVGRGEGESDLT